MYCYRKYGHNENDEPRFTQPLMYERIKQKPSPVEVYAQRLSSEGVVTPDEVAAMTQRRVAELETELEAAKAAEAAARGAVDDRDVARLSRRHHRRARGRRHARAARRCSSTIAAER